MRSNSEAADRLQRADVNEALASGAIDFLQRIFLLVPTVVADFDLFRTVPEGRT